MGRQAPVVISTWAFGREANEAALTALEEGGNALELWRKGFR